MQVQEEEFAPACMQRSEETAFADANHLFDAHAGRNSLSLGKLSDTYYPYPNYSDPDPRYLILNSDSDFDYSELV
jgi:hypothetical protein